MEEKGEVERFLDAPARCEALLCGVDAVPPLTTGPGAPAIGGWGALPPSAQEEDGEKDLALSLVGEDPWMARRRLDAPDR
jgi:hypothetical protein